MTWDLDITLKNRIILNSFLKHFTLQELNKIPQGFSNNIIWNIAHTIIIQQILVYKLSGLPTLVSEALIEMYKKDTKPERDVSQEEVEEIKNFLFTTIEKTIEDYNNGLFKTFNSYTVSTKSTLTNVEEAAGFNNFHGPAR